MFEEPSGLESLAKEDAREDARRPERARDTNGGSATAADNGTTETLLNDDLMEQVSVISSSAMKCLLMCRNTGLCRAKVAHMHLASNIQVYVFIYADPQGASFCPTPQSDMVGFVHRFSEF